MIARKEFPNPQFEREDWLNLNGEWDFAIDMAGSGKEKGFFEPNSDGFDKKINIPFCPESKLSGIEYKDFIYGVWYRRSVNIEESKLGGRILLHIGASDWKTEIFVGGKSVGMHLGGFSSFYFDITDYVKAGENSIVIYAEDDTRALWQASGKQSTKLNSYGCFYTRTTGIWQTVWLEFVPESYIKSFRISTDVGASLVTVSGSIIGSGKLSAVALYEGSEVGCASCVSDGYFSVTVPLSELHLWDVGCGRLYDLVLSLDKGGEKDTVKSYFGMREIGFKDNKFMLNGRPVFQRFVLDQGFYPDGVYTAPTDEDLLNDIKLSMDAGFNGARLHQKVFEPRFLYHCDCMGYMVWGEYANFNFKTNEISYLHYALGEWLEVLERDINHPSIICWCPFNETICKSDDHDRMLEMLYKTTKAIDSSRPCIDASGWTHTEFTDVFDLHDYSHNLDLLKKRYGEKKEWTNTELFSVEYPIFRGECGYKGQPVFISEYGGIGLKVTEDGWGYNSVASDAEGVAELYCNITKILLDCPNLFGFCYTQLYDLELEQNGIYTYERKPKIDIAKIRATNTLAAAIEK